MQIISRLKEKELLDKLMSSKQAEFIALYGRRRIGKTFLIQQHLSKKGLYLECTGLKDGKLQAQLHNFTQSFSKAFYSGLPLQTPKSWREAFELLTIEIKKHKNKKFIIFLDELPWLATRKSELLQNLDYFWNTEWSKLPYFKLIVCGSAASWMIANLINAKGGLYNRVTKSILLEPFNLSETKEFLKNKKIKLNDKQILDLYMVMGGIPFYLNQLDPLKSLTQNINEICFRKDGLLHEEFPRLFRSLFERAELNLNIVREIAKRRYGIDFKTLVEKVGKKAGGRFKERLQELEAAGFIQGFLPYGRKKRDHYYKVIDEYTLFYLKWIEEVAQKRSIPKDMDYWTKVSKTPSWLSWAGYSFENICYKHSYKIIKALHLESTGCLVSHWHYKAKGLEEGSQIDLLLEREDNAITLCEIKYSSQPFSIDKAYARQLRKKIEIFEDHLKQPKQIFLSLITTSIFKENIWSEDLINQSIELKNLF